MKAFSACSPENDLPSPDNNFYPSWLYRIEISRNHIDSNRLNYLYNKLQDVPTAEYFIRAMQDLQQQIDKAEGVASISNHPYAKVAYEQVKDLLPKASKFVGDNFSGDTDKWYEEKAIEQIPELVNRLERGIPPNEILKNIDEMGNGVYETEPAYLSAILLAGWIYESYWQKKNSENIKVMKYKTMCRLLLKACEDSRLMRQC
jgi:hypothetical protein